MYIDLFFVLFVLYGFVMGFSRGIIRTIFGVLSFIAGLLAALKLSPYVVNFLEESLGLNPLLSLILGLILCFLVIMWAIRWMGKGLEGTLKKIRLNFVNKILGGFVMALLMSVVFSAIIWFLDQTHFIKDETKLASRSYPYIEQVPEKSKDFVKSIKPVFQEFWSKVEEVIDRDQSQE
jgi:membrane protein required for colicin V production